MRYVSPKNYIPPHGYQNISRREEEDENESPISTSKLILFFIGVGLLIILVIIILLIVSYKFIIKNDIERTRKKKKHPELYLFFKERRKVAKYIDDCFNGVLYTKTKYKKLENPKISVIIPVYNKEIFVLRILRSIQNQSLKDIEIIFCDDNSYDNSTKLIEEYQKDDERILLIKHTINKGTLITRNDGANLAKGEYLLFIDGDDILINDILEKTYYKAKKNDIDIP